MPLNSEKKSVAICGDNPIHGREADVLGRWDAAISFAQQVLSLDASEGIAVSVFGPWGSGKTSFVNLARTEFERQQVPLLDFNPWMFSGAEQLVERFFAELSAEMGEADGLKDIGEKFRKYGDALNTATSVALRLLGFPLVEEIVTSLLSSGINIPDQPASALSRRKKLTDALGQCKKPIIVVLDDVDRLSAPEIRDVLKLVRLTASFPNLIYIVVCDRLRVEKALCEQGLEGRDYLEKIIQLPFDLPTIPRHLVMEQTSAAIKNALDGFEKPGSFDEQVWCGVYADIVRPLIRNLRDIRRYAAAIHGTAAGLDGRVAQVDMLGLEAVRIFLPDVFRHLPAAIDGLTVTSGPRRSEGDFESGYQAEIDDATGLSVRLTTQINKLIEAERPQQGVVKAMIRRLFPGSVQYNGPVVDLGEKWAKQQLEECRVAHELVLRFYLERVPTPD